MKRIESVENALDAARGRDGPAAPDNGASSNVGGGAGGMRGVRRRIESVRFADANTPRDMVLNGGENDSDLLERLAST